MFRQVAQRLACTARRGLSTSAVCREGDKGPAGLPFLYCMQSEVVKDC